MWSYFSSADDLISNSLFVPFKTEKLNATNAAILRNERELISEIGEFLKSLTLSYGTFHVNLWIL